MAKKKGIKPLNVLWGKPYVDPGGNCRKRWLTVGAAFPDDKGGHSVKVWIVPPLNEEGGFELLIRPGFEEPKDEP